jgi:uncharacterized protein (TIGR02594 family)
MKKLPTGYEWLNDVQGLPRTIHLGLKELGVKEVVGRGSNATIIGWRDELNQAGVKISGFSDDDIPWCGLFAAIIAFRRMDRAEEVVKDPLWARNWAKYGTAVKHAALGDVLVFVRNGGGHVGFYVAEDKTAYHVLGGNQSNKVSIARIAKNRCIAVRRPPYRQAPAGAKSYVVSASGKLSQNER